MFASRVVAQEGEGEVERAEIRRPAVSLPDGIADDIKGPAASDSCASPCRSQHGQHSRDYRCGEEDHRALRGRLRARQEGSELRGLHRQGSRHRGVVQAPRHLGREVRRDEELRWPKDGKKLVAGTTESPVLVWDVSGKYGGARVKLAIAPRSLLCALS